MIILNGMCASFFWGHSYNADAAIRGITLGDLHRKIQTAKEAQAIFEGHTRLELAAFVGKHIAMTKPPKGIDEKLHEHHQDVASVYATAFILTNNLDNEEAIELAVMFNAMPLYTKIPPKALEKRVLHSDRSLEDDLYFYDAHEGFAADHKHYLSEEQVSDLINTPHKLRVHWYKAREVLKLALSPEDD
ncbi:MAG: hypothetical protein OYH77_06060 [Pseudomonadota bacterium]|nr:hypothetical protein [Pseudomonadota bacterium]